MPKLITFGETMVQYNATYNGPFVENGTYVLDAAGAESNFAINLGKINPAVETIWVSRLGEDKAGKFILENLKDKIKMSVKIEPKDFTGISYLNHIDINTHVKKYIRKNSAASKLDFNDIKPQITDADAIHLTGITPALSSNCYKAVFKTLEYSRKSNIPIILDINYRSPLWSPSSAKHTYNLMLQYPFILKMGLDEAETVWQLGLTDIEYAKYFQDLTKRIVILTNGENGAVLYDGISLIKHSGYKINVIDPIGAGDAFMAGFVGSLFTHINYIKIDSINTSTHHKELESSLKIANVCGALTCTSRGDTVSMPTMNEALKIIEKNKIV
jgi:2-dehydro-3-deoxygluconokinase